MKPVLPMVLAATLTFALAGCSAKPSDSGSQGSTETATVEDGQNPVMNFIGNYAADRATVSVQCKGTSDAFVSIVWSSSDSETSEWTMSGTLDTNTLKVSYTDGVRVDSVFDENGNSTDTVVYRDGTGTITFDESGNLTWDDEKEHVADGMTFSYVL